MMFYSNPNPNSYSKLASIVAPVVLFCAILPRYIFFSTNEEEVVAGKYIASLLSPTAFTFGADIIASYEYGNIGVQSDNLGDGTFSMSSVLSMLIVDTFLYLILALYFDRVLPQEFGTPLHPLFFLQIQYWCPRWYKYCKEDATRSYHHIPTRRRSDDGTLREGHGFHHQYAPTRGGGMIPRDSPLVVPTEGIEDLEGGCGQGGILPALWGLKEFSPWPTNPMRTNVERIDVEKASLAKVIIRNLKKVYCDGKIAVSNLNLCMLENEIFCLLGHNGAGKTTTVGMLTGLIGLSSGYVSIYNHDLEDELAAIRKITGICPQHNVLIPSLTVREHLNLFGQIKGLFGRRLTEAVDQIIEEIGLVEKKHVNASSLSGGMQRKLSLAIALLGDPKFCLLDEPTSGMDPYSRRSTWELLMKKKKGKAPPPPFSFILPLPQSLRYHNDSLTNSTLHFILFLFFIYVYRPHHYIDHSFHGRGGHIG